MKRAVSRPFDRYLVCDDGMIITTGFTPEENIVEENGKFYWKHEIFRYKQEPKIQMQEILFMTDNTADFNSFHEPIKPVELEPKEHI